MKANMLATVTGVKSIQVDRDVYTSMFLQQPADFASQTSKGIEVMKVSCDVDVFNSMPREGYPLECNLEVEFRQIGGGKMGQHVVKAVPVRAAKVA